MRQWEIEEHNQSKEKNNLLQEDLQWKVQVCDIFGLFTYVNSFPLFLYHCFCIHNHIYVDDVILSVVAGNYVI